MMEKFISIFIFLFIIKNSSYSQNTEKFTYIEKDSSEIKIDIQKEYSKILSSKKAIIYCNIYDRSLNPPEAHKKEIEGWLNPYNIYKFHTTFSVFNIESNDGFNINFFLSNQSEKFNKLKRSTVFVLSKDSIIIKELSKIGKDLSIYEVSSFQNKNNETIKLFQLVDIKDFFDFQWKTNQLLYNLDNIPLPEKKEITKQKTTFFQIGFSSGTTINKNNTNFNGFLFNQIDFQLKKSIENKNKIIFGGGISIAQNSFNSISNILYSQKGVLPIDSIYASISKLYENYTHQSTNISLLIAIKIDNKNNDRFFEFNISPFLSIQSKLKSTVTGGSIKTFGFKNQINEFLYDIPELGLKTQTEELINLQNSFNTFTYGLNAGISYYTKIGALIFSPNINLKLITIYNKNSILNAYSISENRYNGFFATLKNSNFIVPTIGLSILF